MMDKILTIINGAKGTFVYGILSKWYLLIAIPAMTVTYIVFQKLQDIGLIDRILKQLEENMKIIEHIAFKCSHLILELGNFIQCIDSIK